MRIVTRLISGGLIATYHCPSHCAHCLYNSGPKRPKRFMTAHTARDLLRLARKMGCRQVHVGGGEPLTNPEAVAGILGAAAAEKTGVEYVETNCAWHTGADTTRRTLKDLKRGGLTCLLISISPFHNQFIPFSKTKAVMALAREAGIRVFPWVADFLPDLARLDETRPHPMTAFGKEFGQGYAAGIPRRYWIHPGGRALDFLRPRVLTHDMETLLARHPESCAAELSDTSHFHMDLDGYYVPGLCSGLSIRARDLERPLDADKYPVITLLYASGIRGLAAHARQQADFIPTRSDYVNKCDLCTEIRSLLAKTGMAGPHELKPGGFYSLS